jgi:hypothetical protein
VTINSNASAQPSQYAVHPRGASSHRFSSSQRIFSRGVRCQRSRHSREQQRPAAPWAAQGAQGMLSRVEGRKSHCR